MASCGILTNNSINNKSSALTAAPQLCFWMRKAPSFQNTNPTKQFPFDLRAATHSQVVLKTQKINQSGNRGHLLCPARLNSMTKSVAPAQVEAGTPTIRRDVFVAKDGRGRHKKRRMLLRNERQQNSSSTSRRNARIAETNHTSTTNAVQKHHHRRRGNIL
ncbi:unnamed protein product [Ectocarpus sp. 8 AP-2014]